jgi:glucokinase
MRKISIGADIGGSHITTMAVDLESGAILRETHARCNVNAKGGAGEILTAWKSALNETIEKSKQHHLTGIGFAMPGPFDYPNGIAWFSGVDKFDALYGVDIRREIKLLPAIAEDLPVRFLNDATCFAIGEGWLGTASKYNRVLAITLGTGFGSAFLDHGVPVSTGDEVPLHGWVYHLPFGDSIADDHFSTRWFIKRYKEQTGNTITGALELASKAMAEPAAMQIFTEFGNNLGQFLSPLIRKFEAHCLIIGGNISQSYHLFSKPFLSGLESNGVRNLHVYVSSMGEDAAIAGSARLSDNEFYKS